MKLIPEAPLFRDPIYDGAADPSIIWNSMEKRGGFFIQTAVPFHQNPALNMYMVQILALPVQMMAEKPGFTGVRQMG